MPRVQPGAKTQAAAAKVEESDKPVAGRDPLPKGAMDPTDQDNSPMPDEAQQPAKPPARKPAAKPAPAPATKKPSSSGDRFVFTPLAEADDFMILTMYGPAGTRKTTSSLRVTASITEGRVLVIAAESGLKRQALAQHGVDVDRVVFWPPRGETITYEGLEGLFHQLLSDLEKDSKSWAGITWDSLTEVIQTLVDNAAAADIAKLKEIARMAKKTLDVRPVYEREGSDYQTVTGQFRQLLRKYRTLPCHQVFVALEENRQEAVETEDGRKSKVGIIGPAITPAIRMDIEQHSDVIMRVSVTDVPGVGPVGIGRATPAEDLRAKDRYDVLPVIMIDPGWERIWAYVTGDLKIETDDAQQSTMAKALNAEGITAAVESPGEKRERQETVAAERKAAREEARTAAPKRGSSTRRSPANRKVTAEDESPRM